MDKMMKSVKMRAMNVLHFALLAAAMLACWFIAYAPMLAGSDYIAVSLSVCVFYVVFTGFLYRAYNPIEIYIFCHASYCIYIYIFFNTFKCIF